MEDWQFLLLKFYNEENRSTHESCNHLFGFESHYIMLKSLPSMGDLCVAILLLAKSRLECQC